MKIEPVTKLRRKMEKKRELDTSLLAFANGRKKEKPLPILGIIKGGLKDGSV